MVAPMLKKLLLTMIASIGLFVTSLQAQEVPSYWPYQGILFDVNGAPLEGSVNLTMKVYESVDALDALWEGTLNNVGVRNGTFSIDLGTVGGDQLKQAIEQVQAKYIGITVNEGIELSPRTRIGSMPYATLAGNALKLGGQSVDQFVTETELQTFGDNFQGGLSTDDVNALIDARGYLNTAAINALIDDRNYINSNEVDRRINAAINAVNTNVANLQTNLTNLQTTVQNLQNQINTLLNQGSSAFILGLSATATNGWIQFNNEQGVRAAGEMCKSSYPNEAGAHYCSLAEVQEALSINQYDASINGVATWVYSTATPGADTNYCQSLLYLSGHAAVGTTMTIDTASNSTSGGNGIRLSYDTTANCANANRVLCCR